MPEDEISPVEKVLAKLSEAIEKNGKLSTQERGSAQLEALQILILLLAPLPEKVARLERKNLLMLIEKHPWASAFCVALFFFVLEIWHSEIWRPWLYALLGIPTP